MKKRRKRVGGGEFSEDRVASDLRGTNEEKGASVFLEAFDQDSRPPTCSPNWERCLFWRFHLCNELVFSSQQK